MKTRIILIILVTLSIDSWCQDPEENKGIVIRYFEEVVNNRKIELLGEIFADTYLFHNLEDGTETRGIKQLQDFLPYFFKAFPDVHYTLDQIIAEKDDVVIQTTITGTQKGEFYSYPASNNKIQLTEIFFYKIKDKKIQECRRLVDLFHLDKQLKGTK